MPDTGKPKIAALVPRPGQDADRVVREFVAALRGRGLRVRGLLQELCPGDGDCTVVLVDLDDGRRYPITQDLGTCSVACRLDASLLAEASAVMRRIATEGADLAIFNRFGGLEAEGDGFAAEMLALMTMDIPVLTVVPAKRLCDWRNFTGEFAVELPADAAALAAWFLGLQRDDPPAPR